MLSGLGRGEACTGFWLGNLRERGHWENTDIDGSIILRLIFFMKWDVGLWSGLSWLRILTVGGRL
jgi:hypothetical protein